MATPVFADLWQRVLEATARGLRSGALLPIETRSATVAQTGLCFALRVVDGLRRKDAAREAGDRLRAAGRRDVNPFLPHDPALWVADLSPTHHVLLNKFCVVPHHLLLVTRTFVPQERWLDRADFEAMSLVLSQIDGLGFYNGGAEAGASQPHKHLQLVPLPLVEGGAAFPLAPLLEACAGQGSDICADLPFAHALASLPTSLLDDVPAAAAHLHDRYRALADRLGLGPVVDGEAQQQPYNLLLTRRLMWLVPRSQEHVAGISINALGYAGALLVRDQAQLDWLRENGPLEALRQAGVPLR